MKNNELQMEYIPLVSVVVPVYNVAKYLHRSIDSILAQTYRNLEILIIDDGSTDGSAEICDYYASIDTRIRVFHKNNGGLSDARNMALDNMTGDYVTFVDSDDYIALNMIEKFYHGILETNADMVVSGMNVINEKGVITGTEGIENRRVISGEQACKDIIRDEYPKNFAWGKMYKSSLFENIRFPKERLYEDTATTYRIADNCQYVCCLPDNLYYYEIGRPGNTTSELQSAKAVKSYMDGITNCHERLDFIKDRPCYQDIRPIVIKHLHLWALLAIQSASQRGYSYYCLIQKQVTKSVLQYTDKPCNISLRLAMYSPWIYYILYSLYSKIRK